MRRHTSLLLSAVLAVSGVSGFASVAGAQDKQQQPTTKPAQLKSAAAQAAANTSGALSERLEQLADRLERLEQRLERRADQMQQQDRQDRQSQQASARQQRQQDQRQQEAQGEEDYRQYMRDRQQGQTANRQTGRQSGGDARLEGWTYDEGDWETAGRQQQAREDGQWRQADQRESQQRRQSEQATRQQRESEDWTRQQRDQTQARQDRQQDDQQMSQQRRQTEQATRQQRDTSGDWTRQQDDQSRQAGEVLLVQPVAVVSDAEGVDEDGIQDVIYSATKAALVADFDDVVERFLDADRNRIGEVDLDALVGMETAGDRITRIWERKFGTRDIDIEEHDALAGVAIFQGEVGSSPMLTSAVLRNSGNFGAGDAGVGNEPEDFNMEDGRDIAVAIMPSARNVREVQIPLISEFPDRWKINVPDNLSAARLHSNLVRHLDHVADNEANWPATEEAAFRYIAQHVMMGVLGHPVPQQ